MQIFEQDTHAFTRRLNGVLVPGPMCYVAKIDAFVVGNSQMGVDCYKYQVNLTCLKLLPNGRHIRFFQIELLAQSTYVGIKLHAITVFDVPPFIYESVACKAGEN